MTGQSVQDKKLEKIEEIEEIEETGFDGIATSP